MINNEGGVEMYVSKRVDPEIKKEFDMENRERKNIAHSARNRVGKTKKCTFPSDTLSKKDKKNLNGEVSSISLNKPVEFEVFCTLSKEIQQEYINHIQKKYEVGVDALASAVGCKTNIFRKYARENGLTYRYPKRKTEEQIEAWNNFMLELIDDKEELKMIRNTMNDAVEANNHSPEPEQVPIIMTANDDENKNIITSEDVATQDVNNEDKEDDTPVYHPGDDTPMYPCEGSNDESFKNNDDVSDKFTFTITCNLPVNGEITITVKRGDK